MNPETKARLTTATTFSKLFAAVLFIIMPFLGVYIGYTFAPEKVVEVNHPFEIRESLESDPEINNVGINQISGANFSSQQYPLYFFIDKDLHVLSGGGYELSDYTVYNNFGTHLEAVREGNYMISNRNVVYLGDSMLSFSHHIKSVNPEAFKVLQSGFAKDDKYMYYRALMLDGARTNDYEFESIAVEVDGKIKNRIILRTGSDVWVPNDCKGGVYYTKIDQEKLDSHQWSCYSI